MNEPVQTRQELVHYMEKVMNASYSALDEEQKLATDTTLVKTYLIEANLREDASIDETQGFVRQLSGAKLPRNRRLEVGSGSDGTLYWLTANINREALVVYIDASNPRFWVLHSANKSTNLDWFIDRLIKAHGSLDRSWLWPELLESLSSRGSIRGLGLDYDRRPIPDIDFEAPDSVEYLKLQLWGMQASRVFSTLRHEFPRITSLSKIKVKHWSSDNGETEFAIDDIKYDGKITTRGNSFQRHREFTADLYREYARVVRRIETKYALTWHNGSGRSMLSGDALSFRFSTSIKDLGKFCERVFSASLPFRLWGVPTKLHSRFYRVAAVDLHASCRLGFELTPDYIRLYLPRQSCGNTIARLYANLKHHYDPRLEAVNGDGEPVFQLQSRNA